jgi:hypothetical protein
MSIPELEPRCLGGGWLYEGVDACPGLRLDRDMSAGQNAEDWTNEVGACLERGEDAIE